METQLNLKCIEIHTIFSKWSKWDKFTWIARQSEIRNFIMAVEILSPVDSTLSGKKNEVARERRSRGRLREDLLQALVPRSSSMFNMLTNGTHYRWECSLIQFIKDMPLHKVKKVSRRQEISQVCADAMFEMAQVCRVYIFHTLSHHLQIMQVSTTTGRTSPVPHQILSEMVRFSQPSWSPIWRCN
jgi:hypothetical protein